MKQKPFHESVVTIIRNCDEDGLCVIEELIQRTKIPQNHEAIIRALRYRRRLAGLKGDDPDGVIHSVIKQRDMLSKTTNDQSVEKAKCPFNSKWPEKDGVIYFNEELVSDGTTGPEWVKRLEAEGKKITKYAKSVLLSPEFKPTNGTKYKVAVLKGEIFNDNERTTENIRKKADLLNLQTPNAELACILRERFSDKQLEDMGLYWIVAMHEPIKDFDDNPRLVIASRSDNGSWLHTDYGGPGNWWSRDGGFAFAVSQVSGS